jgi:G3E family GTPase
MIRQNGILQAFTRTAKPLEGFLGSGKTVFLGQLHAFL